MERLRCANAQMADQRGNRNKRGIQFSHSKPRGLSFAINALEKADT